jgi:YVTN family beta-propeller protein
VDEFWTSFLLSHHFPIVLSAKDSAPGQCEVIMPLKIAGTIAIPGAGGSEFDHAAFDARSRRIFIAHTARDRIEVIDHDAGKHTATLPGFPGAAGAVADDGQILVTNRGSASITWLDASTLEKRATFKTGGRPNGAVIVARSNLGIAACIGVDGEGGTVSEPEKASSPPGDIIPEWWARSSRNGGRDQIGTVGEVIPEWWATSSGISKRRL